MVGQGKETGAVAESPVGSVKCRHVLDEPTMQGQRDRLAPRRERAPSDTSRIRSATPLMPVARGEGSTAHDRVIDRRRERVEHAGRQQGQLTPAEIAGGAHDPVVSRPRVLHDHRDAVDDDPFEMAPGERIGGLPRFAPLAALRATGPSDSAIGIGLSRRRERFTSARPRPSPPGALRPTCRRTTRDRA